MKVIILFSGDNVCEPQDLQYCYDCDHSKPDPLAELSRFIVF